VEQRENAGGSSHGENPLGFSSRCKRGILETKSGNLLEDVVLVLPIYEIGKCHALAAGGTGQLLKKLRNGSDIIDLQRTKHEAAYKAEDCRACANSQTQYGDHDKGECRIPEQQSQRVTHVLSQFVEKFHIIRSI